MKTKKPRPKTEPRNVGAKAWYYVNKNSIDLVAEEVGGRTYVSTTTTRLTRRMLKTMLTELA